LLSAVLSIIIAFILIVSRIVDARLPNAFPPRSVRAEHALVVELAVDGGVVVAVHEVRIVLVLEAVVVLLVLLVVRWLALLVVLLLACSLVVMPDVQLHFWVLICLILIIELLVGVVVVVGDGLIGSVDVHLQVSADPTILLNARAYSMLLHLIHSGCGLLMALSVFLARFVILYDPLLLSCIVSTILLAVVRVHGVLVFTLFLILLIILILIWIKNLRGLELAEKMILLCLSEAVVISREFVLFLFI